jgi:hypothetical protein
MVWHGEKAAGRNPSLCRKVKAFIPSGSILDFIVVAGCQLIDL